MLFALVFFQALFASLVFGFFLVLDSRPGR
jgi:hypothetical protein